MELPFKPITPADKDIITNFTFRTEYKNCDLSFANMCSWRFLYHSEYAVAGDFLFIRFYIGDDSKRPVYMCPVGTGRMKKAIALLEEDSASQNYSLQLLGVTPLGKIDIEKAVPGKFEFIPDRDYFDYIYMREDMVNLTGKKYQPKRNHINNFKKRYSYEYMPLTKELIPYCLELESIWYRANLSNNEADNLNFERRSMTFALNHFEELGLVGGGLCVNNNIVAFAYGAPITYDTFGIHVEKADINYEGAYSMINREFASRIPEKFLYINREEDLGIPGLRQAKQSYQPVLLLEKYSAILK